MDPISLVALLATLVGILLAGLNIREKLWPKPPPVHPLAAPLREIAHAIRDQPRP